jgi:hypothetical protein
MRVAVDRELVLSLGRAQYPPEGLLSVGDVRAVVLALAVVRRATGTPRASVSSASVTRLSGWGSSSQSTPIVYQWL